MRGDAAIRVAGQADILAVALFETLLEACKDRRGEGIQNVLLGEEALPVPVVLDCAGGDIRLRRAALVDEFVDGEGNAAAEQPFEQWLAPADYVKRIGGGHANGDVRLRVRVAVHVANL